MNQASLHIMQKPKEERTTEDKQVLELILSGVQMFKDSKLSKPEFSAMSNKEYFGNLSECLEHVFYEKGSLLFHQGKEGSEKATSAIGCT